MAMSTTTRPPEVRAGSPYVGPRPFTREDRESFFGRDVEVDRLVSEVISSPTLVIYSVSGAGKTSLLAAGLRPALRDQGFVTLPTVRFAARAELPDVRNVFTHMTLRSLTQSDSQEPDPRWLADPDATLAGALKSIPPGRDADGFPQPRALVFDQFEELFSLHDERWPDRKAFMAQVWEALDQEPELRVVFALREEYLGQFGEHAGGLPRTRFHLERLRHDAAMRAVTGPLEGTDRTFGEGVAERLVKDLQGRYDGPHGATVWGEFVEPLHLQVVCRQLWSRLDDDAAVITRDHLAVYGNVDEALTSYYDDAVAAAAAAAHMPEWKVRQGLEKLFVTSSGTRSIVFEREAEATLGAAAIAELGRLHLVRTEWRAGAAWLELAHDRLIAPIRNSDAGVLQARRRVVFLRTVSLVALVLALIGGAGLAWIVSLSNSNSALQSSTAAQKTTVRVLHQTVAATDQQKRLIRTTLRAASNWVNAFNVGNDALAARYMLPVVALSTSVTDHSTTKTVGKRFERAVTYLKRNPCSLGPSPQLMGSNQGSAAFLVDPVGQRPHHKGCQVGPPWLLTITVKHGKVTGLDSRSLAAALARTHTTTTSATATSTGAAPTTPTGFGGPPPLPPPSSSSGPSSGTSKGATSSTGPPSTGTGRASTSTTTPATTTATTPQTGTGVTTTVSATSTAPTSTTAPTVSTFTIVTTTTPGG
jgi:conflict system STAND superfamily ATPase